MGFSQWSTTTPMDCSNNFLFSRIEPTRRDDTVMKPMMKSMIDSRDDRIAREMRDAFGRCGWLVSWHRLGDDSWLARLSCPDIVETVEEFGRTRREAIVLAEAELTRRLAGLLRKRQQQEVEYD